MYKNVSMRLKGKGAFSSALDKFFLGSPAASGMSSS